TNFFSATLSMSNYTRLVNYATFGIEGGSLSSIFATPPVVPGIAPAVYNEGASAALNHDTPGRSVITPAVFNSGFVNVIQGTLKIPNFWSSANRVAEVPPGRFDYDGM